MGEQTTKVDLDVWSTRGHEGEKYSMELVGGQRGVEEEDTENVHIHKNPVEPIGGQRGVEIEKTEEVDRHKRNKREDVDKDKIHYLPIEECRGMEI